MRGGLARGRPVGLLRTGTLLAAVALSTTAGFLISCTSPPRVLSALLEPGPPPKSVVHRPRRPPYKKPNPYQIVELKPEAPQTDWPAKLALLPKDANGATDWVTALKEKLITPKPGIEDNAEDQPALDLNVELVPKDMPDFKATYPHQIHTTFLACTNCHTGIFQMEKGADPITMEKIFAGEYCGRCHGKVAFDVATGCPRCHLSMPK
jgi:c(7)-type cytochrome triheme protein